MNVPKILRFLYYTIALGTLFTALVGAQAVLTGTAALSTSLCGIVGDIRTVIGIIAILLFITGGALYAGAHMLPAAGNLRGNLQGWSMGMIIGAVVGIILVLLAPTLLSVIGGIGSTSALSTCP